MEKQRVSIQLPFTSKKANRNRKIYDLTESILAVKVPDKCIDVRSEAEKPHSRQIHIARPDCGTYQTINIRHMGPRFNNMTLLTIDAMMYPSIDNTHHTPITLKDVERQLDFSLLNPVIVEDCIS